MRVSLLTEVSQLEALAAPWREITGGHPFLGPDWLIPWWQHVGSWPGQDARLPRLFVLAVHDDQDELVALAPWYLETSLLHGRCLKFLGSGKVCSDLQTIACRAGDQRTAIQALADWLCDTRGKKYETGWDLLVLEAVDLADPGIATLRQCLQQHGAISSSRPAGNCWRIKFPESWDEYLMQLSKTNRKRARRLDKAYLQTGRATLRRVTQPDELAEGFRILVDLHTKRWQSRGEPGIFADPGIYSFHQAATQRMLASGHLRLSWLEIDGRPVSAEYCLTDGKALFSYQSGLDPEALSHEPGVLTLVATIQDVLSHGFRELDFLRGDEPYKVDWRAQACPIHDVRILPGNFPGRLRQSLWLAATSAKDWLRAGRNAVLQGS